MLVEPEDQPNVSTSGGVGLDFSTARNAVCLGSCLRKPRASPIDRRAHGVFIGVSSIHPVSGSIHPEWTALRSTTALKLVLNLRSGAEHCHPGLAVEEEEKGEEEEEERRSTAADIKPNNPHLTGGEIQQHSPVSGRIPMGS